MGIKEELARADALAIIDEEQYDIKRANRKIEKAHNKSVMEELKRMEEDFKSESPNEYASMSGSRGTTVTEAMIQQAREIPIETVMGVDKGPVKCINPLHNDRVPSLRIDGGFAYCYGCSWSADSIKVAMTLWGLGFHAAIKRLIGS